MFMPTTGTCRAACARPPLRPTTWATCRRCAASASRRCSSLLPARQTRSLTGRAMRAGPSALPGASAAPSPRVWTLEDVCQSSAGCRFQMISHVVFSCGFMDGPGRVVGGAQGGVKRPEVDCPSSRGSQLSPLTHSPRCPLPPTSSATTLLKCLWARQWIPSSSTGADPALTSLEGGKRRWLHPQGSIKLRTV